MIVVRYLNVSKNLVFDWERCKKKPCGPGLGLFSIIPRKRFEAVA
ncbi:hypothetical protein [Sphingobium sp. Cam5-1]|nr:hypothetical protein [Sphingobium sp. Cam5-1]